LVTQKFGLIQVIEYLRKLQKDKMRSVESISLEVDVRRRVGFYQFNLTSVEGAAGFVISIEGSFLGGGRRGRKKARV
jgi:hypothetical protein